MIDGEKNREIRIVIGRNLSMQMKDILFDKISQTYYFLGDPRKIGIQIFL